MIVIQGCILLLTHCIESFEQIVHKEYVEIVRIDHLPDFAISFAVSSLLQAAVGPCVMQDPMLPALDWTGYILSSSVPPSSPHTLPHFVPLTPDPEPSTGPHTTDYHCCYHAIILWERIRLTCYHNASEVNKS